MTEKQIINELASIEAFADELKRKAAGLRAKLAHVYGPAPTGGVLSDAEKSKLLANRKKSILKRIS